MGWGRMNPFYLVYHKKDKVKGVSLSKSLSLKYLLFSRHYVKHYTSSASLNLFNYHINNFENKESW